MNLYLAANSRKHIGYTPDWIQIWYSTNQFEYALTLDIQGEIGYTNNSFSCRCKGDLVPWTLIKTDIKTGDTEEIDLGDESQKDYVEQSFCPKKVAGLFKYAESFVVGVYPNDRFDDAKDDVLSIGKGLLEYGDVVKQFVFECELNI